MTVVLIVWILCAGLCALMGHVKHRDPVSLFMVGLAFGVFGLAYVLLSPARNDENGPALQ